MVERAHVLPPSLVDISPVTSGRLLNMVFLQLGSANVPWLSLCRFQAASLADGVCVSNIHICTYIC